MYLIEYELIDLGYNKNEMDYYILYVNEDWYIFFDILDGEICESGVSNWNAYYDITKKSQIENLCKAWEIYDRDYKTIKEKFR